MSEEAAATRRLAVIVAVDVAGYSARTAADEDASTREIALLTDRVRAVAARHGGRVFNTAGDGFMLEFPSASAALEAGEELARDSHPPVRVGVHLGEVRVTDGGDLLGHGVNVAARIQALAPPQGVLASADVQRAIRGALAARLVDRGEVVLEKMGESMRVYALVADRGAPAPAAAAPKAGFRAPRRAVIAGAAVGAAALAGAGGYVGWRVLRGSAPAAEATIAVLPFDNLSSEPQLAYFADGLSEDILDALVRAGMRVTSRTSSFEFRGAAKARAGAALKVDYLLDGSVTRDPQRLRVSARLTDVARGQVLWSQSYDRAPDEGLTVEDEIAGQVASALKVRIKGAAARQTVDAAAYELYLQGREVGRQHTPESVARGGELLRQAVARDPGFAKAWFEIAVNMRHRIALEPVDQQFRDAATGQDAARRALAIDPGYGGAYALLATLSPLLGRWRETEAMLRQALAMSPNDPDALMSLARFQFAAGRVGAALEIGRQAFALNPFDQLSNETVTAVSTYARRFDETLRMVERMGAIWPGRLGPYWGRFWLLFTSGRLPEAAAWLEDQARRPDGYQRQYVVFAAAVRAAVPGGPSRDAAAADLVEMAGEGMGYACEGVVLLTRMGLAEPALELARAIYLKTGAPKVERNVQFIGSSRYQAFGEPETLYLFHPVLADLRRAGRLNDIFDGVGLTAYWRQGVGPDS